MQNGKMKMRFSTKKPTKTMKTIVSFGLVWLEKLSRCYGLWTGD